eukprot:6134628-Lingulodinium_polyedra.AAC.1
MARKCKRWESMAPNGNRWHRLADFGTAWLNCANCWQIVAIICGRWARWRHIANVTLSGNR